MVYIYFFFPASLIVSPIKSCLVVCLLTCFCTNKFICNFQWPLSANFHIFEYHRIHHFNLFMELSFLNLFIFLLQYKSVILLVYHIAFVLEFLFSGIFLPPMCWILRGFFKSHILSFLF